MTGNFYHDKSLPAAQLSRPKNLKVQKKKFKVKCGPFLFIIKFSV